MCGYGSCRQCGKCFVGAMMLRKEVPIAGQCPLCGYIGKPSALICDSCGADLCRNNQKREPRS